MPEHPEGFVQRWPTLFVQRTLPGADEANRALADLVFDLDSRRPDATTEYREADLFIHEHPGVQWLKTCINQTAAEYFRHLGIHYDVRWTIQGWFNVNRFGDYHDYHNHPRAYLSGTYYVRIPATREPLESRADVRPGCITFYDPRYSVNMTSIAGDPYVEPEYTLQPEPGLLLMWPGFVNHFVHPNLSRDPRISISFNVNLRWSDDYLPRQV